MSSSSKSEVTPVQKYQIQKLITNQFQIRDILGETTMKLKNVSNSEVSDEAMLKRLAFWLNQQHPIKGAKLAKEHKKYQISSKFLKNAKRTEGSAHASQSQPTNFPWIKSKAEQRQRYVRIKR